MANVQLTLSGIFIRFLHPVFFVVFFFFDPRIVTSYESDIRFKVTLWGAVISTTYLLVFFALFIFKLKWMNTRTILFLEFFQAVLWLTTFLQNCIWRSDDGVCPYQSYNVLTQMKSKLALNERTPCFIFRNMVVIFPFHNFLQFSCFTIFLGCALHGIISKKVLWMGATDL